MKLFIVLLVVIALISQVVQSSIIGLDFSSDALKVAIIQPGKALEIVTNFQSKRKTPTSIAFFKGERLFGSDATALSGRKPESSFSRLQRMLGRDIAHPRVEEVVKAQYFPYQLYTNETTGMTNIKVDEESYTPEELVAMIIQHVKDMTKNHAGEHHAVKDCVITVPSSFTQQERESVFAAAEIADLNVLGLIEENTAAALHYATDRSFDAPKNVLFYNLGAGSLQVNIAQFSSAPIKESGKNKTISQFEILGKAFDDTVGGFAFDLSLTELFADKFNEIWKKKKGDKAGDVRSNIRAMVRLKNEANKVKEVLAANNEFPVRMEALHNDIDLAVKVTRKEFEDNAAGLFDRLAVPVQVALERAKLTLADIDEIELLGGAVRMPRVKKILQDLLSEVQTSEDKPKATIGQHLNGDEAMALGAAFHAATLSTSFKVRKIGATDTSVFPVDVKVETMATFAEDEHWSKNTTIYGARSAYSTKVKTIAVNHDKDIHCQLTYQDVDYLPKGTDHLLAEYNITGIADFAKEASEKGLEMPKVHLSFQLDRSGMIKLVKAEATVELKPEPEPEVPENSTVSETASAAEPIKDSESTTETKDDINAGDAKKDENKDENAAPNDDKKDDVKDEKSASAADKKDDKEKKEDSKKEDSKKEDAKKEDAKKKIEKKPTQLRRTLRISSNNRWTTPVIAESRKKLHLLNVRDDERKAKAKAMNDLEAFIYKVKNRISDEEKTLSTVSTEAQREAVVNEANEIEEWLYDEGRSQEVSVYQKKLKELGANANAIFHRYEESKRRPLAVENAKKVLQDIKEEINSWENEESMPQITKEEREKLRSLVADAQKWLDEKNASQESQSPFEKPIFDSEEVKHQLQKIQNEHTKLLKKPKIVKPTVKVNTTTTSNSTDSGSAEEVKVELEKNEKETSGDKQEKTEKKSDVETDKKTGEEL